jgi:hypothetical protein
MSSEPEVDVDAPPVRDTPLERRLGLVADLAFYAIALGFFVYLSRYYVTGAGGPTRCSR